MDQNDCDKENETDFDDVSEDLSKDYVANFSC